MATSLDVDPATRRVLDAYGFDEQAFLALQAQVRDGTLSPAGNIVRGTVEPPTPDDVVRLPEPGDPDHDAARAAGLEVLQAGAAAAVVLNGGMATRFGGVVKGLVEAYDGRTFLELKLAQTAAVAEAVGAELPTAIMTSFATDGATREFLEGRPFPAVCFPQRVSLRLERDGSLFRTADGGVSLYSPGHGDFLPAVRSSGTLDRLRAQGVRYLMVSNVDNLPARLDPVVLGTHVLQGRPMTAEVVASEGDPGGAPARVDGRVLVVESMRFPADFDFSSLPVVNVNTVTFDLDALDADLPTTWLYVEKEVQGRRAVQLEHLYHEASAVLPTTFLQVPATGPRGRFLPVKTRADLAAVQGTLAELLARPPLG